MNTFLDLFSLTLGTCIKGCFNTMTANKTNFWPFSSIYVTIVTRFNPNNSFKFIFVVSKTSFKMIKKQF